MDKKKAAGDAKWMGNAIDLAFSNIRRNRGGPFAAIVVSEGEVLSEGTNLVTSSYDPTSHAEIVAIRRACKRIKNFKLENCELFTTCEPCPMCMAAVYWARIKRVSFATTREDAASAGFDDSFIYHQLSLGRPKRSIKMTQLMRQSALSIFEEWCNKMDRMNY